MFVVTLTYVADLPAIDEAMKRHMAYVRKGYEDGVFVVSGRRVPRVGGVLIATGRLTLDEMEARVAEDPFVAEGLAEATVVEFNASQTAPALEGLLG